ncbi:hypothetical protein [Marisediminicola sp. LYQ134]|uniref:hypothetical protein n=1 Tax=unclassified Marisediminicola TaxID=2618316 RepID=UPI003983878D
MTTDTTLNEVRDDADVVWAQVEDDFYVGSVDGNFLGYIDRQDDGRYLVSDPFSRGVGHFAELDTAMRALEQLEPAGRGRAGETA